MSTDQTLLADGFDDALIGVTFEGIHRVVYDKSKMIDVLCKRDSMTPVEADEYLDFNVWNAWAARVRQFTWTSMARASRHRRLPSNRQLITDMNENELYSGVIKGLEVRLVAVEGEWAVDIRIEEGEREGEYVDGFLFEDYEKALFNFTTKK